MSFLILYDIEREDNATRLKANRYLRRIGAEMLQFSVWEHPILLELLGLAKMIEINGGKALILEKKIVMNVDHNPKKE